VAVWSNRVLIVLGAVGIFITGVLSYATRFQLDVPCGGHMGCAIVQNSEFAKFPAGTGISVSYLGLLGYLALFGIAVARGFLLGKTYRRLSAAGFVMAIGGTLFSLYLTFISLYAIRQKCVWCLSSLGVILLTTIAYAALLQSEEPEKTDHHASSIVGIASLLVAFGFGALSLTRLTEQIDMQALLVDTEKVSLERILPIEEKTIGPADAKVTLVEFMDVNCGTCRNMYPRMKSLGAKYPNLRIAFRNFPLITTPGHEYSSAAAAIGEYAAEKGMFWRYMDEMMKPENEERIKSLDGLIAVAGEAGLSRGEIITIFQSGKPEVEEQKNRYWARVDEDFNLAQEMLVASTPTFVLYAEGEPAKAVAGRNVPRELEKDPYASLLKAK
jgi:protein-disulfide isomerase